MLTSSLPTPRTRRLEISCGGRASHKHGNDCLKMENKMSLTTTMGVKLGPLVLGTLLKHYLERNNVTRDSKARNELLFDEAFIIVKAFMEESTKHTVEELQQFSNTRIPSPPWVHCVRVMIPLSSCDEAAPLLIQALGGPEAARQVAGGTKWWQVRGVKGVDAQWVAVKRDWREAERRRKQRQDPTSPTTTSGPSRFNSLSFKREASVPDLRRSRTSTARADTRTNDTRGRPASAHGARNDQGLAPPKRPATSGGSSHGSVGRAGLDASTLGTIRAGESTPGPSRAPTPLPPSPSPGTASPDPKSASAPKFGNPSEEEAHYESEMDDMRCMLYIHGGGYYFGSVDQQRYCVQRYARKMAGRVFAVNYRLAPQYPFPCALHDCLAAYLYLIRPPPDAEHLPVPPNMLIIAGDSAGGGMTLALLQIIRDVGLPAPAGGILISPWCDLTHSFPSVLVNTATDIIPPYGLSLHKPSPLWPPPSDELTAVLRGRMTQRLREVVKQGKSKLGLGNDSELDLAKLVAENSRKADESKRTNHHKWWKRKEQGARGNSTVALPPGATLTPVWDHLEVPDMTSEPDSSVPEQIPLPPSPTPGYEPLPRAKPKRQSTVDPSQGPIEVEINGEIKTVKSQIQFYAQNHQLTHPLVSPALGYLGGLPPLLVLASDKEVLRDEIIYIAHKAAHPDRYPVKPETKELLPSLKDIESKEYEPTKVHLQVYDETCHVLPLFSFTTPAKYCYRAIALFCKHVTGYPPGTISVPPTPEVDAALVRSPDMEPAYLGTESTTKPQVPPITPTSPRSRRLSITSPITLSFSPSRLRRRTTRRNPAPLDTHTAHPGPTSPTSPTDDIAGPRFFDKNEPPTGVGTAGDPSVYNLQAIGQAGFESPFKDNMIRERVATDGIVRPLEPESDLPACNVPLQVIGTINAAAVGRYLQGQALWDTKFSGTIKSIAKTRVKNLELARKEGRKSMGAFYGAVANGMIKEGGGEHEGETSPSSSVTFLGSANWSMGWALEGENPPPSSIVSRRDTAEARQLAICADRDLSGEENKMSGNNLWNIVVDFLSQNPDRGAKSSDPLAGDHLEPSGNSSLGIQVQPPTPSSLFTPIPPVPPVPPANPPTLTKRRSSGFLRKLMGKDSTAESSSSGPKHPLSVFIDPSRNSGLPEVEKPS
ncbi:putative lipase/esterase from carbohydrate esterase family CE10 protein [Rhizoctonia solani 123E]|uniref:Putative lipase/esterase from carbohydrate esterase family CE10 protein n=1 Tax=Rhizoctonia solani 123E TaxID=1423351 RepID=A0A074S1Q7_9AGAM|nr:putative lipase/esterase from carbohydrate esterase family CE10 protein [Rhizoctonia solani 123E]